MQLSEILKRMVYAEASDTFLRYVCYTWIHQSQSSRLNERLKGQEHKLMSALINLLIRSASWIALLIVALILE